MKEGNEARIESGGVGRDGLFELLICLSIHVADDVLVMVTGGGWLY